MAEAAAPRSGRIVRAGLAAITLSVGVGLAAIPVGNWFDQRGELDDARVRRAALQAEIDAIEGDIEGILGPDGFDVAARCRSFYVEPGEELYAVPGLQGCVTHPTP
ncbi:MAG: hypothetical protein R8F63_03850 [Acidimicrobiales bacterium]|nr:hypothetical protein [Acidimicrobiales bacterium]